METVRIMEIIFISARDLKKARMFSKTKAFAVAWISNNHKNRQWTPVDKDNGTDPTWNQVMNFILNEDDLQQGRLLLEIVIYRSATFSDKEIGRVRIPLIEFLKSAGGGGGNKRGSGATAQFVSYQVRKPSGKPKGVLNLSVKLAEKATVKQPQIAAGSSGAAKPEVVTTYPVCPPVGWSSTPPPHSLANNLYPPPPYSPANNQYPPPPSPAQAIYPSPPPYYQSYHRPPSPAQAIYPSPPPCYQSYRPPSPSPYYEGDYPYQDYPPYQGYPHINPELYKG